MQDSIAAAIENIALHGAAAPPPLAAAVVDAAAAATPIKKKPGRPRKIQVVQQIKIIGILAQPENPANLVELTYTNPIMFQKIMGVFVTYNSLDLELLFLPDRMRIATQDHTKTSTIYVDIDAKMMNSYFCGADKIKIYVKREIFAHAFDGIGKATTSIQFTIRRATPNQIAVSLKNARVTCIDTTNLITLSRSNVDIVDGVVVNDDSKYPLKYSVPLDDLKQIVSQTARLDSTLRITKTADMVLEYHCDDRNNKIEWERSFLDPKILNMESTVGEEPLSVAVAIAHIKPFTTSCIGVTVMIAVDRFDKISLSSTYADKSGGPSAATVKVYTEIKNIRDDIDARAQRAGVAARVKPRLKIVEEIEPVEGGAV